MKNSGIPARNSNGHFGNPPATVNSPQSQITASTSPCVATFCGSCWKSVNSTPVSRPIGPIVRSLRNIGLLLGTCRGINEPLVELSTGSVLVDRVRKRRSGALFIVRKACTTSIDLTGSANAGRDIDIARANSTKMRQKRRVFIFPSVLSQPGRQITV